MNNLELKVKLKALDKLTAPLKEVIKTTKSLTSEFAEAGRELKDLEGTKKTIKQFNALQAENKNTRDEMNALRETTRKLHHELTTAAKPTSRLRNQYIKAQAASAKLEKKHDTQRQKLKKLKSELKASSINVRKLGDEEASLSAKIKRATAALDKQNTALNKRQEIATRFGAIGAKFDKLSSRASDLSFAGFAMSGAGFGLTRPARWLGEITQGFVETASKFEDFKSILETTERSSAKAEKAMDWVSDFAASTPYEIEQVVDSFVKLRTYGLDPTNGLLQTLGDTAAAMKKPVMQAVEAIADAIVGENERLKGFGIKASTKGQTITYRYSDAEGVERLLSVNKNDRAAIEAGLTKIWNEKFSGSMDKQSKNWRGILSNLMDYWTRFQNMVMESGAFTYLKEEAAELLATIKEMDASGELKKIADDVGEVMINLLKDGIKTAKALGKWLYKLIQWARDNKELIEAILKLATALGAFLAFIGPIALAIASLMTTFAGAKAIVAGLGVAFSVIGAPVVAVIAAIAGAAYLIYKHWEPIKAFFTRLWDGVKIVFTRVIEWIAKKVQWLMENVIKPLIGWVDGLFNGTGGVANGRTRGETSAGGELTAHKISSAKPLTRRSQPSLVDNSKIEITVTAPEGGDARAIADEVNKQLDNRQKQKRRRMQSRLHDWELS